MISALARFHATSFCYFQDNTMDIGENYPELWQQPVSVPTLSKDTIEEISKLFESKLQHTEYQKYSHFFLGQTITEEMKSWNSNMKSFGVFCHGNFCRENLFFKYKSNLESRLSCCDVVFQDLSRGHYG